MVSPRHAFEQGGGAEPPAPSPDLNLKLLRHLVEYLGEYHSIREMESIAARARVPVADFINCTGWVTLEQFETILAASRVLMPDDAAFVEACAYKADVVSGPIRLVLPAVSPAAAYQTGAKIMHLVTRISSFEAQILNRTRVRLLYRTTRPESRLMCLSRYAQIRSVPRLWGLPHAQVEDTSCVARGDACCTYEVRLREDRRWLVTTAVTAGLATVGIIVQRAFGLPVQWYWLALVGAVLGYLYEVRRVAVANQKSRQGLEETYAEIATGESNAQRDIFALVRREQPPTIERPGLTSEVAGARPATGSVSACPDENTLLARTAGSLAANDAAVVDEHIDVCSDCRRQLADAARGTQTGRSQRAPNATFAESELVADRYLIKRRLASGGMGEVYEAHDSWIGELVALKTIIPTIADNQEALARLKTEVRLARQVTHDNVCRVFDLGFWRRGTEQIAYLTMELVRGATLRQRVRQSGPFSAEAAKPIVQQMILALSHAHASGVIHRDFKSDNVMLVDAAAAPGPVRVVVTDFGLARSSLVSESQPLTSSSHTIVGTLDYMSPEQVQGLPTDEASDIFSVGVVLFELLSGRLPYEGESPLARALKRVTDPAPDLLVLLPKLDPGWSRCVARCLEANPADRFASLNELLHALELDEPNSFRPRAFDPDGGSMAVDKQHVE
jgi:hypothetical protein